MTTRSGIARILLAGGYRAANRAARAAFGGPRSEHPDPDAVPERLERGQSAITMCDGQRIGLFRDRDGVVHKVVAICTHGQSALELDTDGPYWTCPRHGARFSMDGRVLNGPATEPLEQAL